MRRGGTCAGSLLGSGCRIYRLLVLEDLLHGLAAEDVRVEKALLSPIRGRKGNRELLFLLRAGKGGAREVSPRVMEKIITEGWV